MQTGEHAARDTLPAGSVSEEQPFALGDWVVEPRMHALHKQDEEVRLEPKVMQVLLLLVAHHGNVVSRREMEEAIWPGVIVTDDAVTNTVIKLRRALGDRARSPHYIETIAKSGYRLIADVHPLGESLPQRPVTGGPPERHTAPDSTAGAARSARAGAGRIHRWHVGLLPGLALVAAIAAVWWFAGEHPFDRSGDPKGSPPRPVVAVLPFENLSADPDQDYFADGITQDLITDLSKLTGLQVVARNSVLAYRGSNQAESEIGRELGASHIVNGSVQRSGQRLRINVQLTDAVEERNRWAERYDRQLADIFRIQEEIAARVVSALQVELAPGEQQRLTREYAASVEAYDQYLRGIDLMGRRSGADITEARVHLERAIQLEPDYARAYASLAQAYALDAVYRVGERVGESLAHAEVLARKAEQLDDSLPQVYFVLSQVALYQGRLDAALDELAKAIALRPSYADAYGMLAWVMHFAGKPEKGLDALQRAMDLNPRVPAIYRMVHGALLYQLERPQEAVELLEQSVEVSPSQMLARLFLGAVYVAVGDLDAASWQLEELQVLDPGFTLDALQHGFPIRDPAYRERLLGDLQRAAAAARRD